MSNLERQAQSFYSKDTDSFEYYSKQAINEYIQNNDTVSFSRCYQNLAFSNDEIEHDYPAAFVYATTALFYYDATSDTLRMANMYKYIGYLYGKLGIYGIGHEYINRAISFYKTKQFDKGVYVSLFDLATLYASEGSCEKAVALCRKTREFWIMNFDASRIFSVNNQMLECIDKADHVSRIPIIRENDSLRTNFKLPDLLLKKFEQLRSK